MPWGPHGALAGVSPARSPPLQPRTEQGVQAEPAEGRSLVLLDGRRDGKVRGGVRGREVQAGDRDRRNPRHITLGSRESSAQAGREETKPHLAPNTDHSWSFAAPSFCLCTKPPYRITIEQWMKYSPGILFAQTKLSHLSGQFFFFSMQHGSALK